MGAVGDLLEGTFVLILVFLVLSNALSFSVVMGALTSGYVRAVSVLQGHQVTG